jgi:hypothetical protein
MKPLIALLVLALLLFVQDGNVHALAFISPLSCPPMKWCPDPVVKDAYTICWQDGAEWVVADYMRNGWLYRCEAVVMPGPFESPLEKNETNAGCCEGWWQLDPWMDKYPLWTDGAEYYVEGWKQ